MSKKSIKSKIPTLRTGIKSKTYTKDQKGGALKHTNGSSTGVHDNTPKVKNPFDEDGGYMFEPRTR